MGALFKCCFYPTGNKKKENNQNQKQTDDAKFKLHKSLSLKASRFLENLRVKPKVMNHETQTPPVVSPSNPDADSDYDSSPQTSFHSAEACPWEEAQASEQEDYIEKLEFLVSSSSLIRSCSDLATLRIKGEKTDPKSVSCREIIMTMDTNQMEQHCRVIKKHSSARILPSKSQSVLWKLQLWSSNIYCKPKLHHVEERNFIEESESLAAAISFTRVDEWVKESRALSPSEIIVAEEVDVTLLPSPGNGTRGGSSEIIQANSYIKLLDSSSTVAHVSGAGLRVVPSMSHFSSLRAINLSGNYIVDIPQGSLPKSLHAVDLSKNKIQTIQGFRELTRLRNLDLSNNRISQIGQGLSSCTMIKELYLSGNKISMIEGLHRLLKLSVLDLSNNKITAAKALGQLVANYNSLIALDLSGNPLQTNISNDHLRKIVRGVLPKLALLNKDPIDPQKAREINADAKAKGNRLWNKSKRSKSGNRLLQSQWSSTSTIARGSSKHGDDKKMKQRSKSNVAQCGYPATNI